MAKTNHNHKSNHSKEWCLSKELAKRNKKLKVILTIVVALWLVTVIGWGITLKYHTKITPSKTVSEESLFIESDG